MDVETLKGNIARILQISQIYSFLSAANAEADKFSEKLKAALNSKNPQIFSDEDRQPLSEGVFSRDFARLQKVLIDFRTLRDTADIQVNPMIQVAR